VVATQAGHGQNTSITPGQNRAILTLANGRQIILDSTQGNIVNQGRLRVVNFAGKLQYEGIGTPTEYNTITTPKGSQYQIVLPDGSKVWLNTASSIKFPTAFSEKERTIEITGEVYLEVSPEARSAKKRLPPFLKGDSREAAGGYAARQPFIVSINNGTQIQVLGTSFNINAYPDETSIKTTLIEGSVKIISNTGANGKQASLILKPGQQATVLPPNLAKENKVITILPADIEQTLAWKNGTFQLAHTTLAETMRQLARWYDIEVVYEKGVPDIKLDGDVKRNLTLPQMLDVLNSLGVKLRMEGRRMIVLR
jgi:ferric-dicitrate binding protein FerR (iron transport regulator)